MTDESLEEVRSERNNSTPGESSDVSWEGGDMHHNKQQPFQQPQCYRSSIDGSLHGASVPSATAGDWSHYYYNHNAWGGNLNHTNSFGSPYLHSHQLHHYHHQQHQQQQMQPGSSIHYPSYYGHHENGWSESAAVSLPTTSARSSSDGTAQDYSSNCENFSPNRGLGAKSLTDSSPDAGEYQHASAASAAAAAATVASAVSSSAATKPSTAILYDWMQIKRVTRPPKDKSSALYGSNNNVHHGSGGGSGKDGASAAEEVTSSGAVHAGSLPAIAGGFAPAAVNSDPAGYMLKRPRTSFSSEQILELEKEFHYNM